MVANPVFSLIVSTTKVVLDFSDHSYHRAATGSQVMVSSFPKLVEPLWIDVNEIIIDTISATAYIKSP
jgi:hypothetical protein